MANKERGEVKISLDKERTIKYTLNSLIIAEENGVNLQNGNGGEVQLSLKDIRTLLHAGLIHEDDALTPEAVGEMITMDNMSVITEALNKAFSSVGK